MIFDKLENAKFYYPLSPEIKAAFEFIASRDWKNLPVGKYVFNDNIFANLQEYITKMPENAEFEVHKKYFDIQFMIFGCENMAFGNLADFKVTKPYNPENDVAFGDCKYSTVSVNEGYFTLFTPYDVHKPSLCVQDKPQNVKKVIVKIKIQ